MKQYVYSPTEVGLDKWPEGTLRLNGEVTSNPSEADVFVYPGAIHELTGEDLRRLPHFAEHESRHVFFHCADHETLYATKAIIIRCNTRDWMLKYDPNTISWPWPVEDFAECVPVNHGGFAYDVSFHGWRWSEVRQKSIDSVKGSRIVADIAEYSDFFGHLKDEAELERRRNAYRASLKASRVALCPESIPGTFPYRFFEAMSAARVPLLVGSKYVLPWSDVIDYREFALFGPAAEAHMAGAVIREFVSRRSNEQIIEMGQKARAAWERYLDSRRWVELMSEAVERKLAA